MLCRSPEQVQWCLFIQTFLTEEQSELGKKNMKILLTFETLYLTHLQFLQTEKTFFNNIMVLREKHFMRLYNLRFYFFGVYKTDTRERLEENNQS